MKGNTAPGEDSLQPPSITRTPEHRSTSYTKQDPYTHHTPHTEKKASKPHTSTITETQTTLSTITPLSNPQPPAHLPPPALLSPSSPQPHTYASVLASPPPKQPTPPRKKPPSPVLTVQDLIRRFRNKPAPFRQPRPRPRPQLQAQPPTPQYDLAATVKSSVSKFLLSALPAFTEFLLDIQGGVYNGHTPHLGARGYNSTLGFTK